MVPIMILTRAVSLAGAFLATLCVPGTALAQQCVPDVESASVYENCRLRTIGTRSICRCRLSSTLIPAHLQSVQSSAVVARFGATSGGGEYVTDLRQAGSRAPAEGVRVGVLASPLTMNEGAGGHVNAPARSSDSADPPAVSGPNLDAPRRSDPIPGPAQR